MEKKISKRTNRRFIDIDREIEGFFFDKHSIREIYQMMGEKKFRKLEEDILEKYIFKKNVVISTGGGVVEIPNSKYLLQSIGWVYYLHSSIEILKYRWDNSGVFFSAEKTNGIFSKKRENL